jgi:ACT domain-containing protein
MVNLEKMVEYIILTVFVGGAFTVISGSIRKVHTSIKGVAKDIKELSREVVDLKLELPEKYLRCTEFDKFKEENKEAHKELRTDIIRSKKQRA